MTQQSDSLITDEMRNAIGIESEPGIVEVEKETIRRLADALGDDNPLWRDEEFAKKTSWGGIIAFPIALHPGTRSGRRVQYQSPARSSGLVAGDEWEFLEPIRPGDRITVTSKIVDFYEDVGSRGKMLFTVTETTYRNQHNRVALIARRTGLAFGPRPE